MSHWAIEDSLNDETEIFQSPEWMYPGNKAIIYVIDAHLFAPDENEGFQECLQCIEADMLKNILENPKDLSSIIFFNTEKSTVPTETEMDLSAFAQTENCSIFIPLEKLSKKSICHLKSFMQSDHYFDFENNYGTSNENSLNNVLWMCSKMIGMCGQKLSSSNILIFTNNEQPYLPGSPELQQTFIRAKDLCEMNAKISIIPINDEFDNDLFFKEFLCIANDEDIDLFNEASPIEKREALTSRIFQRNSGRTCVRHLILKVTKDLGISCDVHSFIQKAWKPKSVKIHRDTNEVVVSKRQFYTSATNNNSYTGDNDGSNENIDNNEDEIFGGNESLPSNDVLMRVLPGDYIMYQEICGKAVTFEPDELKKLKVMLTPGIGLLGFKPIATLRPRFYRKQCQFLYPNEKWIEGSSKLFRALWEKCLEKQKYALCTLTLRRGVAPQYVALVPQTQEEDENDGFKIIFLPFQDDYNELNALDVPPPEISEKSVEAFEKICKKLSFPFNPKIFSNPSFLFFYANIEALVYEEDAKETIDNSLPDIDRQNKKIQPFIQDIADELGNEVDRAKRPATASGERNAPKMPKTELSLNEIESMVASGRANNCTVQNLKDFITSKGVSFPQKTIKKDLCRIAEESI